MSQKKADVKTLLEAGAHFGHRSSRWNPKMREFIYTKRGGIHIIDLLQTAERLDEASEFVESVAARGKGVLFTGTKKHIAPAVAESAESVGMPHVTKRWFGGILTNFETISQRIKYYKKLSEDLASGELEDTYNKREILEFEEKRDKLAESFAGIADMTEVPGALFVADVVTEKTAVAEANRLGIPVIGIVDTNADPSGIDYPIPANDDAVKTVALISNRMAEAVRSGADSYAKKPSNKDSKDSKDAKAKPAKKAEPKTSKAKKSASEEDDKKVKEG